jgi:hypothetical protein
MKNQSFKLLLVLIIAGLLAPANSQIKKVAQTGLQFLKVEMSPRSAAMGGAYTLAGNDATAMFSNPAGMALSDSRVDFFAGQVPWIADISYNALAGMISLGNLGKVGVSFINSDYGDDIIGTRYSKTEAAGFIETGKVDVGAYAVGVSYARSLTDKFTVGVQVKHTYQHLGSNLLSDSTTTIKNEVDGLAYDFGTVFYPGFKSFRFGMSIRNFSKDFKYQEDSFSLPLTFRIGFAMDLLDLLGDHANSLLLAVDAIHPRDYTERINIGTEYVLRDMFAFRLGYRFNYDVEGLTAGFGAKLNVGPSSIRIDYAYSDMGVFDTSNRVAVGFSF